MLLDGSDWSPEVEHTDYPSRETWEERWRWFRRAEKAARGEGSYLLSEQACALTVDVQAVFCVGAWIATIVLAATVIDAVLREVELPGFRGNTRELIDGTTGDQRLHTLRTRRNALVHVDPDSPAITVDQQWADRPELEGEAREAVELMFEVFYMSPGT